MTQQNWCEPWSTFRCNCSDRDPEAAGFCCGIVDGLGNQIVFDTNDDECKHAFCANTMERIAACVNACKDMPTEGVGEIIKAMRAILACGRSTLMADTMAFEKVRKLREVCEKYGFEVEEMS